jgi:hypothetical protein
MDNNKMTDAELDRLLATATTPELPKGFSSRLQAKLDATASTNVIAFPKRTATPHKLYWLSTIPLAASLAFGVYLGAQGSLPETLETTLFASATDMQTDLGIEDTESFLNGDLS